MRLHELKNVPGAIHRKKRVGCGEGGGHGKTSGRGGKGQTARSGGSIRPGFEGGQMPLYRKLPHRGFNQAAFRVEIAIVNVGDLASLDAKITDVNAEVLATNGLIRRSEARVKILGDGELSRALNVSAADFSESAKAKIEKAGGRVIVTEPKVDAVKPEKPAAEKPKAEKPKSEEPKPEAAEAKAAKPKSKKTK